jgi:hypothetical protein
MNSTITEAAICISGSVDYDFGELTSALAVEPTKIWRCNSQVAEQALELNKSTWIYELPDLVHVEFSKVLADILDVFWNDRDTIREFASKDGLSIAFVLAPEGHLRGYDTAICQTQVQRLANFNAGLNFNFDNLTS